MLASPIAVQQERRCSWISETYYHVLSLLAPLEGLNDLVYDPWPRCLRLVEGFPVGLRNAVRSRVTLAPRCRYPRAQTNANGRYASVHFRLCSTAMPGASLRIVLVLVRSKWRVFARRRQLNALISHPPKIELIWENPCNG